MCKNLVVVLGASPKVQRFSNKAIRLLLEYGHSIMPVHPKLEMIEGLQIKNTLSQIKQPVATLTLYVGEKASAGIIDEIIKLSPKRVIFNPGTESAALESALKEHNIYFIKDCTLVMLREKRF